MPLPITKVLYCTTGSYSGSGFAALLDIAPTPFSASAFGWVVGQNNPPAIAEMSGSYEVLRTDTLSWLSTPSASIPNRIRGNCWESGPYNGEFIAGRWNITMSVKSVTRTDSQVGNFLYKFWKGSDVSGSNATLISSTLFTSSRNPAVAGGTNAAALLSSLAALTCSANLPSAWFRNEYLFIQTYWNIVTGGDNNGDDENLVFGISASVIKPTPFVADYPQFIACSDDGMR